LDGLNHRLSPFAGGLQTALGTVAKRKLCRENNVVALVSDEFSHHPFSLAKLILIRSVHEVAAGLTIAPIYPLRFLALGAITPPFSEIARSQGDRGDAQAGLSKNSVAELHESSPDR